MVGLYASAMFSPLLFYRSGSLCRQSLKSDPGPKLNWRQTPPGHSGKTQRLSAWQSLTRAEAEPGAHAATNRSPLGGGRHTSGGPDTLQVPKHVRKDSYIIPICFYGNPGATRHCGRHRSYAF